MAHRKTNNTSQGGFALLMTLIVVTVVIAIGLTVLDLSTKQIRLSTNAKDSEIAFHAANAGMECARYWRRAASLDMENGNNFNPSCFSDGSRFAYNRTNVTDFSGSGRVTKYDYSFTWAGSSRCSEITTLVASSTTNVTINNLSAVIPGYPTSGLKDCGGGQQCTCRAGEKCSILSVRGYNKPCASSYGYGTVQREVLLQF